MCVTLTHQLFGKSYKSDLFFAEAFLANVSLQASMKEAQTSIASQTAEALE